MRPPSLLHRASPSSARFVRLSSQSQPALGSRFTLQQPCIRRQFSQGRAQCAQAVGGTVMRQNRAAQQSREVAMKEQLKYMDRESFPDDFGLLPGTFIRPVWSNLPSIFKDPKGRLKLEWAWLKSRTVNLFGLVPLTVIAFSLWNIDVLTCALVSQSRKFLLHT